MTGIHVCIYMLMMRCEEGRKKQARSNKQQSKATQHIQGNYMYVIITYAHTHDITMKLNIICREFV